MNAGSDSTNAPRPSQSSNGKRHGQSLISIGEVSTRYGLGIAAIRRYIRRGKLRAFILPSGHRRFRVADVESFLGMKQEELSSAVIAYCRVSSNKQSAGFTSGSTDNDLGRQIERLKKEAGEKYGEQNPTIYSDTGSGLSFTRRAFCKLLDDILSHKLDGCTLLIAHKDRLARLGAEIVELVCRAHGIRVVYVEKELTESEERELTDDLLAIITHFSARSYGMRSARTTTKVLAPETMQRAKELCDLGTPLWQVVRILNEEGHTDSKGAAPSFYVLKKQILGNEMLEIALPREEGRKNSFQQFHDECIRQAGDQARLPKKALYSAYVRFCVEKNLGKPFSAHQVGALLRHQYKYTPKYTSTGHVAFCGIALK